MSEKPIIFSGPMVRAILDGRKTQTRRVIKPQPLNRAYCAFGGDLARFWIPAPFSAESNYPMHDKEIKVPYREGGLLWVRETHHIDWLPNGILDASGRPGVVHYRADLDVISQSWDGVWRPSIYMPRWCSRLTLRVMDVRVERVQDISDSDAKAEGCESVLTFSSLWDTINQARGFGWDSNPWCWCISFRRINSDEKMS